MASTCRVFPESLPNRYRSDPKRSAEVLLYDCLVSQLGSGWVIFYSVAWLAPVGDEPRDGETDFIVAHPTKGILLIEVKGGAIRFDGMRQQWVSRDRQGVDHDIDPLGQVKNCKYALLAKLGAQKSLQSKWIGLSHAVAFPHIARPKQAVTLEARPEIIIGSDDMDRLHERVEEILDYWRGQSTHAFQNGPQIVGELEQLIGRSIQLTNPLALEAAEDEREIVRLTEEQFRVLDMLNRIRRAAIGGCAGAGKTFLAVEKAKRLAREGYRTLLTCYNRPLADFLAQRTDGTENLEVMTFHRLCAKFGNQASIDMQKPNGVNDGQLYNELFPNILCQAVDVCPDLRYDAIVVDEGQDFREIWWIALESCLRDGKQGIFYVFYDDNQAIYARETLPSDLIPNRFPLDENIRNTRAIFRSLAPHYRGDREIRPRGPTGRTIETLSYNSIQEMGKQLSKVLTRLVNSERFTNQDLVVLTPKGRDKSALWGLSLPDTLKLVEEQPAKPGRDVYCTTIHSFKGLERPVIIVAELDTELKPELYYVAFSRPRVHLVLLGAPDVLNKLLPVLA